MSQVFAFTILVPLGFQMHLGLLFIQFMVMGNYHKLFAAALLSKVAFM